MASKVFAIDISGSTSGSVHYYDNVQKILNEMYQTGDIIIEWNHEARMVGISDIRSRIANKSGTGATEPVAILSVLPEKHISHLILVTDGQVYSRSVDNCDQEIQKEGFVFDKFDGFIIGRADSANLSVTCPFTRSCQSQVTQIEPGCEPNLVMGVTKDDLAIIDNIKNISTLYEFMDAYPVMERVFIARLLGTPGDQELRKEVIKMQKRIIDSMAKNATEKSEVCALVKAIEANKMDEAIGACRELLTPTNSEFEKSINALIRMCDGGLRLTFNANEIKSFRAIVAEAAPVVETISVDDAQTEVKETFECPVSYEYETDPVILVAMPEMPILSMVENKNLTEMLINCPLEILNMSEICVKFKECIDHPLSLKMMREADAVGAPIDVSPLTRKKLIGGLPLGASEEHVKAANWTLTKLTSGKKRLGNPDMWFAVVWLLIENGELPFLEEVLPFVREQMVFRLKNHLTAASLTGLSTMCQARIPLAAACWFCVVSPLFTPSEMRNQNLLRYHLAHVESLLKLIELAGYKLPDQMESIINRTSAVAGMLHCKRQNPVKFETAIRCLYQNSIVIEIPECNENDPLFEKRKTFGFGKFLIPVDGPATEESREMAMKMLPARCRKVPAEELVWLSKFIDANKSATDNEFPLFDKAPPIPEPISIWRAIDARSGEFAGIKISPNTMRPYSIVDGKPWIEKYHMVFGENAPVLVGCDVAFCNFIRRIGCIPTAEEYILYYSRNLAARQNPILVLPSKITEIIRFRLDKFHEAIAVAGGIGTEEIVKRFDKSCELAIRPTME